MFVVTAVGTASAQQSSEYDDETYGPAADDQVTIMPDGTGEAAYHRDALLADAVEKLSGAVTGLAVKMERGASQSELDRDIVALSHEADAVKGLTKKQRAQVRRLVDRAIIKASTGDVDGLKDIRSEISTLWGKVKDHEVRITRLESERPEMVSSAGGSAVSGNVPTIVKMASDADKAKRKADEAMDLAEKLAAEVEALKNAEPVPSDSGQVSPFTDEDLAAMLKEVGEAKARADDALAKANEALELAKNGGSSAGSEIESRLSDVEEAASANRTALAEVREKMEKIDGRLDHVETMAHNAMEKANEALRVASDKADPGIVEIGLEGLFSGGVTGALLGTGMYWFKKYDFRIGIGGGIGYGKGEYADHGWGFETKLSFGYEIFDWWWAGLSVAAYGVGDDLSSQNTFGYDGTGFLKFMVPDIDGSGISLAATGFVGGANEFHWTEADPPAGLIEGATYDDERLVGRWTWIAGCSVSMLF